MKVREKTPLERYMELPEGYPAELIEGEIVVSPSPDVRHQRIALRFLKELLKFEDRGEVFYETNVHFDEENVLRPDVVFILRENEGIVKRWIEGVPDMVVEVVSPTSAGRDMLVKRDVYERFGVKEYWIVDPENEEVYVYVNEGGRFVLKCHGKRCDSKILKDLSWGFD